ncbi:PocR ligand-binding domain-containing protein [Lacticaseibacillus sp. GG6-2]
MVNLDGHAMTSPNIRASEASGSSGGFGIRHLLDIDALQRAQDEVSKISGVAIVTVDSKGVPITKETGFTRFCALRRQEAACRKNCFFSDAYGGLKAAMLGSPYVYLCPAGLMDCAVPIVVEDAYLGAVLMGQVRAEDDATMLEHTHTFNQKQDELSEELQTAYWEAAPLSVQQLQVVSHLFFLYVQEMVQKQLATAAAQTAVAAQEKLTAELATARQAFSTPPGGSQLGVPPKFVTHIMNAVGELAAIEGANQTNELVCIYAEMLSHLAENNTAVIALDKELEYVKDYLKVQSLCFPNVFTYTINREAKSSRDLMIPRFLLFTFVENAVIHGVLPRHQRGEITIDIVQTKTDFTIRVSDNGLGMSGKDLAACQAPLPQQAAGAFEECLNIESARRMLMQLFGAERDIQLINQPGHGLTVTLTIPLNR